MKNDPTTPVQSATGHSKTSARSTPTTKLSTKIQVWWMRHEIDVLILGSLIGGAILFVMAMRVIASNVA